MAPGCSFETAERRPFSAVSVGAQRRHPIWMGGVRRVSTDLAFLAAHRVQSTSVQEQPSEHMPLTTVVWTVIFAAALSVLWLRRHWLVAGLLSCGYVLALIARLVGWSAGLSIALLLAAAYAVAPNRPRPWRIAGHTVFVLVAILLGTHLLPGFHNLRVIGPVRYTSDAIPFTMYLNLDKPLAGFWLLLVWPALCLHRGAWSWARGLLVGLVTAVVVLGFAFLFGEVAIAPKWPDGAWLWAINNLLIVCLTEEAVFRGYLQEGLMRRFAERRHGEALAIAVAAALFGLSHAAGGLGYVLLAGLAGVGYGVAYRQGGLHAAMTAHFCLNLVHYGLLTYPRLA